MGLLDLTRIGLNYNLWVALIEPGSCYNNLFTAQIERQRDFGNSFTLDKIHSITSNL